MKKTKLESADNKGNFSSRVVRSLTVAVRCWMRGAGVVCVVLALSAWCWCCLRGAGVVCVVLALSGWRCAALRK